ncbi:putative ATP-dependent RNA helicase DHX33 [Echinococcus granulosus]|uniref:RNA helicase n=1 Tax=Echinococcus granulosus TaxID=6210 RepID=A0A068WVU1_ECHGR|nr:putative ATP-dependent RNA helicase DHX33 [Echinococcus granulosus]CDS24264.1 ATP dependent RNA helicase DHX33 [Echinococcus granulosus]
MATSGSERLLEERKKLPVWIHREVLVEIVKKYPNCVIVSSTGSGKTTQLPQFLFEAGLANTDMIAITQPRRIAAISVAHRVAEELGRGAVGVGPVGYCVRFEDASVAGLTRLRYMTDGMLLREACLDPTLSRYSIVIVDEAHERTLNTEVLLGVLLIASRKRATSPKPLKIIVMSATIDPKNFVDFLGPSRTRVVYIQGRQFPINTFTVEQPSIDYVSDAASTCIRLHGEPTCPPDRGLLIFLTGEEEITRCVSLIRRLYKALLESKKSSSNATTSGATSLPPRLSVFPLFAALPQAQQLKALTFSEPGTRKVIVSTNIAETSITIPGIRYVIDCGRAKNLEWDSTTGLQRLRVTWVSKSQAWQRAGRAGRNAPGVCLRLYTDAEYDHQMALHPSSQLASAPLSGVLLNLLAMGVKNVQSFPWLEPPKQQAIDSGLQLLQRLGAITIVPQSNKSPFACNGVAFTNAIPSPIKLTKLGRLMTVFPLAPRFARALCSAAHLNCLIEAIIVVSMLYVAPVFYVPQESREEFNEIAMRFRHPEGDLASLVLVYRAYIKAAETSSNTDGVASAATSVSTRLAGRNRWCRENFLNHARMRTAVKVRAQLRDLVRSSGLGRLHSCGADDFSPLTKAFFEVAFRDQVATLATRRADNAADNTRESFPYYKRLGDTNPSSPLLCIHPDSSLYPLAVVARCPPPAVLFLEAVDSSFVPFSDTHQRVMMRHVCMIPSSWLGDEEKEAEETEKVDVEQSRVPTLAQEPDGSCSPTNVLSLSDDENRRRQLKRWLKNRRKKVARAKRRKMNGMDQELC